MSEAALRPFVQTGDGRTLSRAEFLSLLNTYNCFLKEQTQLHLSVSQEAGGEVVVEGFLNICWGVRRPIRLKIQDDPLSPGGDRRGMTRWGEYSDLHQIHEMSETVQDPVLVPVLVPEPPTVPLVYQSATLRPLRPKNLNLDQDQDQAQDLDLDLDLESNLFRSMSDASLVKRRRGRGKTAAQRERERGHRFSINGHFYNYKTSIFTPSVGTATKVRVSSRMDTEQVVQELLHKFKIQNDPQEFALYCVHQSGEKKKLGSRERPLWERVLQGPSDDIMKIFLMDVDEQEVSNDVAQYLNLELPILEHILLRLREEEHREVQRVVEKYHRQHRLLCRTLSSKTLPHVETSV